MEKILFVYFTLLNDLLTNGRDFIRDGNLQNFVQC